MIRGVAKKLFHKFNRWKNIDELGQDFIFNYFLTSELFITIYFSENFSENIIIIELCYIKMEHSLKEKYIKIIDFLSTCS